MATTVDRLITSFELLDRYTSKAQSIITATESIDKKINRAIGSTVRFGASLTAVAAGGLLALGKSAVDAAAKFERTEVTLKSLTQSAKRTADILDFVKRLDPASPFTFSQLSEAATQLAAFNLPVERTLLLITKLGAAFPNKEMGDFVNIFGRLAAGDFPDIEALSSAGLSKLDFMKEGIKFDAQGSLISSSKETMDALERIVNGRYGTILDDVANTTTSKLASAQSRWEELLRKIGDALVKYVNPALDKLTGWLDKVSKNQGFDKFLKKAAIETLKFTMTVFAALGTLNIVLAFINASVKNFAGAFMNVLGAVAAFSGVEFLKTQGSKALKDLFALGNMPPGANAQVPEVPKTGQENPNNPAQKTLSDIENNTRATARNTGNVDFKKYMLGGGELGQMGIQAIDRFRGNPTDRSRQITINAGKDKLSQAIAEIARQVYEQQAIQGNGGR